MNRGFALCALIVVGLGALLGGFLGRFSTSSSADNTISPQRISSDYRRHLISLDRIMVPVDHEKTLTALFRNVGLSTRILILPAKSSENFQKNKLQFYGIGISILQHRDNFYVQSVIPGTPADKAGIRYGDRFVEIDGKKALEWTAAEVSRNVRGERGTKVKVKIDRVVASAPLDLEIVRGGVPLPSIRNYFLLPNGIGYVGLTGGFQETTASELDEAVSALEKQGMTSLILDLRGNPGGLLPQAIDVVSRFIPSGKTVVSVKGRSRYSTSQELRSRGGLRDKAPLVVLINGALHPLPK